MFRFFLSLLIAFGSILFVLPSQAQAHLGGGPPFMKIDGKDAQTNPYNQGSSTFTMSWDSPPDVYLINKPIAFEINVPELMKATTIPLEEAKDIKIRWSFATGDNFQNQDKNYLYGSKLVKTFTKPGSYLVITEAKLPADSDFILINTVQVDVRPSEGYSLPLASAYVGTQFDDPTKNVLLVSTSTTDPSTKIKKYIWDFGDGILNNEQSVNIKFDKVDTMGIQTVFHRVIDDNGFVSDMGFVAEKQENKLQFLPVGGRPQLPITIGTYEDASHLIGKPQSKFTDPLTLGIVAGILVIAGVVWWLIYTKKIKFV